jgi:hypothetical protein
VLLTDRPAISFLSTLDGDGWVPSFGTLVAVLVVVDVVVRFVVVALLLILPYRLCDSASRPAATDSNCW